MISSAHPRVSHPPPKPLMIWDGDCHFCRRWIERWREITARTQSITNRFRNCGRKISGNSARRISRRRCNSSKQMVESFARAEAVYRSLGYSRRHRCFAWSLRSCSRFRADFRSGLCVHRTRIATCFEDHAFALGQRCSAPDLFCGAATFPARARSRLPDRVHFALDPGRWINRRERDFAGCAISAGGARTNRRTRAISSCRRFAGSTRATHFCIFSAAPA